MRIVCVTAVVVMLALVAGLAPVEDAGAAPATDNPAVAALSAIREQCMAQWDNSSGVQSLANKQISNGLAELKDQAASGNFCANAALVFAFSGGFNVAPSKPLASYWLDKLAASGDANAQRVAFVCYLRGASEPPSGPCVADPSRALYWAFKAARGNFAAAEFALGRVFHTGYHVDQNDADANYWLGRALAHGYPAGEVEALGSVAAAGPPDPDGLSASARQFLAVVTFKGPEPDDPNMSAAATSGETQAQYMSDLKRFRGSYSQPKRIGDWVCWEVKGLNAPLFYRGQVEALRDAVAQIRTQRAGSAATTITTTDSFGFTSTHRVGGSPPTDHLEWMKTGELGNCDLVTVEMTNHGQDAVTDAVQKGLESIYGGP